MSDTHTNPQETQAPEPQQPTSMASMPVTALLSPAINWMRLVAWFNILTGALAIVGTLGLGIIIAWVPIWMGYTLLKCSKLAGEAAANDDLEAFKNAHVKLKLYFTINGVLTLAGLVMFVGQLVFLGVNGFPGGAAG